MVRVTYTLLLDESSRTHIQSYWLKVKSLSRILMFVVGLSCGVISSITLFTAVRHSRPLDTDDQPDSRLQTQSQLRPQLPPEVLQGQALRETHSANETFHKGEDIIAERLKAQVRILCVVLTTNESYSKGGEAVKNTWGKRCNTLLFVSNFEDKGLPVVKLQTSEGRPEFWGLVKGAMRHAFVHHLGTHDWVLRAEDNTFVVVENLRYMLSELDPSEALYLGCRFKKYIKQGFMSAGAGYVLSKEAVTRLVRDGLPQELCRVEDTGTDDVEMGRCMETLHVTAVDTRDSLGRGRFFPFNPGMHVVPGAIGNDSWYWDMVYYTPASGLNCCSDTAVSFNDIDPQRMYVMNYLIYHLRPYGISSHALFHQANINTLID